MGNPARADTLPTSHGQDGSAMLVMTMRKELNVASEARWVARGDDVGNGRSHGEAVSGAGKRTPVRSIQRRSYAG